MSQIEIAVLFSGKIIKRYTSDEQEGNVYYHLTVDYFCSQLLANQQDMLRFGPWDAGERIFCNSCNANLYGCNISFSNLIIRH